MTRKLTFKEWEKAMAQKIADVQEARRLIIGVILSVPRGRRNGSASVLHRTRYPDGARQTRLSCTEEGGRTVRISIRRKKAGVRYCSRITVEHRTISRAVWHKRLTDAMERVTVQSKRPWSIESWTEMTRARLAFAHIWYRYKLRYGHIPAEDFMAYIVMATI